jgi:hypothetical protein
MQIWLWSLTKSFSWSCASCAKTRTHPHACRRRCCLSPDILLGSYKKNHKSLLIYCHSTLLKKKNQDEWDYFLHVRVNSALLECDDNFNIYRICLAYKIKGPVRMQAIHQQKSRTSVLRTCITWVCLLHEPMVTCHTIYRSTSSRT